MSTTPDLSKQLADLTKSHSHLERIAKLSGAHKSHFDTLSGDDAEAFLAKSSAERDSLVQKALDDDKPIWTGEVTKIEVRKRDGALALTLAKQNEANASTIAKQAEAIEKADVRKRAVDHLGGLPGSDDVHDLIVRSLMKSGAKQEDVDAAFTALKAIKATTKLGKAAPGVGGTEPLDQTPNEELEAIAQKIATEQKVDIAKARDLALNTSEGAAAYAAISKRNRNQPSA